jgi:nitroreductase
MTHSLLMDQSPHPTEAGQFLPDQFLPDQFLPDQFLPDQFLEVLATTRAIRRYRPEPIPEDDLAKIMFAATRAPSGSNRQGFRLVVLTDDVISRQAKELLGGVARAVWADKRRADGYDRGSGGAAASPKARMAATMEHFVDHFHETPCVVLACLIRHRAPVVTEGASVYPAVQNMLLAARALGYGGVITMWHGGVEVELREMLGIPEEVALHATISLGRPAGGGHGPVRRRPMGELIYGPAWGVAPEWAIDPEGTRFTQAGPPR